MRRFLALASSVLTGLVVAAGLAIAAAPGVINQYNAICNPDFPTRCIKPDVNGAVPITGVVAGGVTATDAASLTNALRTWAILSGFNGTTSDMIRSGDVSNVASATGFLDVLPAARYNVTTPTLTDTRYNALQAGLRGALHVQLMAANSVAPMVGSVTNSDTMGVVSVSSAYMVNAVGRLWNGTNFSRWYEIINGLNSAGTGIPTVGQVGQCDDTSPTAITENFFGNTRIDCVTHAQLVEAAPSSSAAIGIQATANAALNTAQLLKASAGNLYSIEVSTTTVAGYLVVVDASAVPGAGAIVPKAHCYIPAPGTCALDFDPPLFLPTGIVALFTIAATPYTYTTSATAAFAGQVQ